MVSYRCRFAKATTAMWVVLIVALLVAQVWR
jgi:hypothetical protein